MNSFLDRLIRGAPLWGLIALLCGFVILSVTTAKAQVDSDGWDDETEPELIGAITPKRVPQTQTLNFDVWAGDDVTGIRATGLPPGASFVDNGDGTGTFSWTPLVDDLGEYRVTFATTSLLPMPDQNVPILVTAIPLSHGIYRIGYENGTDVHVSRDHIDHTPPNKIDMHGHVFADPHRIVAAADGRVMEIVDDNTECCSVSGCANCNNYVRIKHSNGEWTKYTHFIQGTVTGDAGIDTGDCVVAGQFLGWEGDVGHTSGSGADNRDQEACSSIDPADIDSTKKCGIHLHWEVRATGPSSALRIPLICGISNNIYKSGQVYVAADCDPMSCPGFIDLPAVGYAGNSIKVEQAQDSIRAATFSVSGTASVAFFAGKKIMLKPGFHAETNSYFHARINDCNSPPDGCPPP